MKQSTETMGDFVRTLPRPSMLDQEATRQTLDALEIARRKVALVFPRAQAVSRRTFSTRR